MISYFNDDDYKALKSKRLYDAYQTCEFSISIIDGKYWYMEKCGNNNIYRSAIKRMKQYYKELRYLYDCEIFHDWKGREIK